MGCEVVEDGELTGSGTVGRMPEEIEESDVVVRAEMVDNGDKTFVESAGSSSAISPVVEAVMKDNGVVPSETGFGEDMLDRDVY
jgi:hypothetical protein